MAFQSALDVELSPMDQLAVTVANGARMTCKNRNGLATWHKPSSGMPRCEAICHGVTTYHFASGQGMIQFYCTLSIFDRGKVQGHREGETRLELISVRWTTKKGEIDKAYSFDDPVTFTSKFLKPNRLDYIPIVDAAFSGKIVAKCRGKSFTHDGAENSRYYLATAVTQEDEPAPGRNGKGKKAPEYVKSWGFKSFREYIRKQLIANSWLQGATTEQMFTSRIGVSLS